MQDAGGAPVITINNALNIFAHVLHGIIAGIIWWLDPFLSVFLYTQFFLYELVEETKIKDEMYHELKEWSTGFIIGLIIGTIITTH